MCGLRRCKADADAGKGSIAKGNYAVSALPEARSVEADVLPEAFVR